MRKAKKGEFPYLMNTVCYFEVFKDGKVEQRPHKNKGDKWEFIKVFPRVRAGESILYAVWPGNWSSDLFIIDIDECEEKIIKTL